MKFPLRSVWALCVLAGSLISVSPAQSQSPALSGASVVTSVRFCPRATCGNRMVGGQFQGSNDNNAWTTLATVAGVPANNQWSVLTVTSRTAFRYLRYLAPGSSYGNIAELEFDGGSAGAKLNGTSFGTPGSFRSRGNDFTKVFDGSLNTYFDAPGPNGNFVGIDLGAPLVTLPTPPVVAPPVVAPPVMPPPAPPVVVPPAPAGLTANPQWNPNCVTCNMPMAHIVLGWQADSGATFYTVYRNGTAIQTGVSGLGWTDMGVNCGQTYSYSVSATGAGGEGPQCAPLSAVAPNPPSAGLLVPPANVGIAGLWQGAAANVLSWQPVPGAAGYNVYVSDVKVASNLTGTTYTITPTMIWGGAIYTVTSVDSTGVESLPSAPTGYLYVYDPAATPASADTVPWTPDTLAATPDWNQGKPRILVTWRGRMGTKSYNVYRDGMQIATGIWRPYYIDANIAPGDTHTYSVTSVNTDWTPAIESPSSPSITATALTGQPLPISGKVMITKVIPNDDSALVYFTPVPGATDYRIYDVSNPGMVKYAGQITMQQTTAGFVPRMALSIEWNGIDPTQGANLVVEAVDKFGPFQRMDGSTNTGSMNMSSLIGMAINGQGDPSNVPIMLAQSDPFHVTCAPVSLTGDQMFFDNFRGSLPLVQQPNPTVIPAGSNYYGQPNDYAVYANDKWEMRQYGCDLTNSKLFFMNNHFMDTTYDGGGPTSPNPAHNNIASMVMMPKATADISGGKVLHVTFEVDAHLSGRRWIEVGIAQAGTALINIAKFETHNLNPTDSGGYLRWQIQKEVNHLDLFPAIGGAFSQVDLMQPADSTDAYTTNRVMWDHVGPFTNGTPQDLDKRHKFDLYVSQTHYRLQETTPDGLYNVVREMDFPAGSTLPFTQCQVYFVHQVYHTANDIEELTESYPYEQYWYNQRPYSDERHWDNMGFSVLDAFPSL